MHQKHFSYELESLWSDSAREKLNDKCLILMHEKFENEH